MAYPLEYAPPIVTEGLTSPLYLMVQNPLYQNAYTIIIMANVPILGSQTLSYGILCTPSNVNLQGMSGLVFLLHQAHQIQLELKMQGLFCQTWLGLCP